jgi:hypothetical protein
MNTIAKTKPGTGLRLVADETIESRDLSEAMRTEAFNLDCRLADLRAEFISREAKLRQDFLDRIAEIAQG